MRQGGAIAQRESDCRRGPVPANAEWFVGNPDITPIFEFYPIGATPSQRCDSKASADSCKESTLIPSGQP
jgi:hypothetical protein